MAKIPKIPDIPKEQLTPTVTDLLEIIHLQKEVIQQLKDEIAILKGQKPKPNIKPSSLNKPHPDNKKESEDNEKKGSDKGKRPGSAKRKKTRELEIHKEEIIKPEIIPEGSKFKGYNDFVVQDIIIQPHNTRYLLGRWQTPDGEYITGDLPSELCGGHFGPTLTCYILHQYYHAHVTQPLILESLREFGVDISSGQLNRIITENKEKFHNEKEDILLKGLGVSKFVNVDDTGARHKGNNGYCTHIGNEFFAWFESTESKSRINFLEILCAGNINYVINAEAIGHMVSSKFPKGQLPVIAELTNTKFDSKEDWEACLKSLGITNERHVRIATEGALIGNILENGFNKELVIMSDDAGQFNVFLHTLCWVHAERLVNKLVGFNNEQRQALKDKRSEIWEFYAALNAYKLSPDEEKRINLEDRFDEIFKGDTCFASLNQVLKRIHKNKSELLLVLDRPEIPLHNNLSENDIREYVKKRKISGSTRSDEGRRCRDTFASLKKTCRKLGISFWEYLIDRLTGKNEIPYIPYVINKQIQKVGI